MCHKFHISRVSIIMHIVPCIMIKFWKLTPLFNEMTNKRDRRTKFNETNPIFYLVRNTKGIIAFLGYLRMRLKIKPLFDLGIFSYFMSASYLVFNTSKGLFCLIENVWNVHAEQKLEQSLFLLHTQLA